jgi:uncharacterized protein YndB with AHSA1/START domain
MQDVPDLFAIRRDAAVMQYWDWQIDVRLRPYRPSCILGAVRGPVHCSFGHRRPDRNSRPLNLRWNGRAHACGIEIPRGRVDLGARRSSYDCNHPSHRSTQMAGNTIRLHRVFRAPPSRVYKAFLDPDGMAKWLPPNGFTGKVHHMDAKVGGTYKMSFTNFNSGSSHSFHGKFLELVPNERLRYTDQFDDPNLPGEIMVTVVLKKVSVGTEIHIEQAGVPEVIPAEACYLGWQESLILLAKLVEAEIPG